MSKLNIRKIISGFLPLKKIALDEKMLRDAGIGVLIQDERWNRLFTSIKKTQSIIKSEALLRGYLDEKTRLHMENNLILAEKQVKLNRIIELSGVLSGAIPDGGEETVRMDIDACDAKIREINERVIQIEQRNGELDRMIAKNNLALLEGAVTYLYRYMKKSQNRVAGLDAKITDMRGTLKERIEERETLDESINGTYNFLHVLLGAKQIESIDTHYTLE